MVAMDCFGLDDRCYMRTTALTLWLCSITLLSGCSSCNRKADSLLVLSDFTFEWYEGDVPSGFNSISIESSGKIRLVLVVGIPVGAGTSPFREGELTLSNKELEEIRRALNDADLYSLNDSYRDDRIADGIQLLIRLVSQSKETTIHCSNQTPAAINKLRQYLHSNIIEKYSGELLRMGKEIPAGATLPPFTWPK